MAKQIEGVYENVLICAKEEFLKKGFQEASLRTIANKAGTSTGSIYTRFQNKEGLFAAIVSPVLEELEEWFVTAQEKFTYGSPEEQKESMDDYSTEHIDAMINYIYDHQMEFRLLLECSEGTKFADFINRLVEIEVSYTYRFLSAIGKKDKPILQAEFLHIVNTAFYNGIFEVLKHNMPREQGIQYVRTLKKFYNGGFEKLYL